MSADRDEVRMQKKAQRKLAAARRRSLTQEERIQKSGEICRHLEKLFAGPEFRKAATVFSYRAMPEEANVDSFNRLLEQSGRKVAYPVSLPNGIMKAAVPRGEIHLQDTFFPALVKAPPLRTARPGVEAIPRRLQPAEGVDVSQGGVVQAG